MRCRWVKDSEVKGGRFWLPECYGGLYGRAGCYCPQEPEKDRIKMLEERIEKLEARLASPADRVEKIGGLDHE